MNRIVFYKCTAVFVMLSLPAICGNWETFCGICKKQTEAFIANIYRLRAGARIEGLLAALSFLPPEHNELRKRITESVNRGISFLLSAQVSKGKYAGAIPRGVRTLPQDHPRFTKSFNRRVTEVRIDYVQHTLSSMIQYHRIFFGDVRQEVSFAEPGLKSSANPHPLFFEAELRPAYSEFFG